MPSPEASKPTRKMTRRSRKSIAVVPHSTTKSTDGLLANKENPSRRTRSKSLGPGGLQEAETTVDRRERESTAPPPKSILKPSLPLSPIQQIPNFRKRPGISSSRSSNSASSSNTTTTIPLMTEEEQQRRERERAREEINAARAERRKSMGNRRVSFAPEATLHTWDVNGFRGNGDFTGSTENSGEATPRSQRERSDSPLSELDDDEIPLPELPVTPARGVSGPPATPGFGDPSSDSMMSSSPFTSSPGSTMHDGGTITGPEMPHEEIETEPESSDSDESMDMQTATFDVQNRDLTGASMFDAIADEEITADGHRDERSPPLKSFFRKPITVLGASGQGSSAEKQKPQVEQQDDTMGEMTMDMTRPIGGLLKSSQLAQTQEDDTMGEMTMDMTRPIGGLLNSSAPSTQQEDDTMGEMTMDMTRPIGGFIKNASQPMSSQEDDTMGEMTMDMTRPIGGLLNAQPNYPKLPVEELDSEDVTMDMTRPLGGILAAAQQKQQSQSISYPQLPKPDLDQDMEDGDEEDAPMDMTVMIGGIKPTSASAPASNKPEAGKDTANEEEDAEMTMDFTVNVGKILEEAKAAAAAKQLSAQGQAETPVVNRVQISNDGSPSVVALKDLPRISLSKTAEQAAEGSKPSEELENLKTTAKKIRTSLEKGKSPAAPRPLRRSSRGKANTDSPAPEPNAEVSQEPKEDTPARRSPRLALTPKKRSTRNSTTPKRTSATPQPVAPSPLKRVQTAPETPVKPSPLRTAETNDEVQGTPKIPAPAAQSFANFLASTAVTPKRRLSSIVPPTGTPSRATPRRESLSLIQSPVATFTPVKTSDLIYALLQEKNERKQEKAKDLEERRNAIKRGLDETLDLTERIQAMTPRKKRALESPTNSPPVQATPQPPLFAEKEPAKESTEPAAVPVEKPAEEAPVVEKPTNEDAASSEPPKIPVEFSPQPIPPPVYTGPKVTIEEFLQQTEIAFLDSLTAKKRPAEPKRPSTGSSIGGDAESSLADRIVSGAATTQVLNMYVHGCRELKRHVSTTKKDLRALEQEANRDMPLVLQEFATVGPEGKNTIKAMMNALKNYSRGKAKSEWYVWRGQLIEALLPVLQEYNQGLKEDLKKVREWRKSTSVEAEKLKKDHNELLQEVERKVEYRERIEKSDPEKLAAAREKMASLKKAIEEKSKTLANLQHENEECEREIRDKTEKKEELERECGELRKKEEANRSMKIDEIKGYKAKVDKYLQNTQWQVVSATSSAVTLSFANTLSLTLPLSSEQPTLVFLPTYTPTPTQSLLLNIFTARLPTSCPTNASRRTLTSRLLTFWTHIATPLNDTITSLQTAYRLTPSLPSNSTLAITLKLTLPHQRTRLDLTFTTTFSSDLSRYDTSASATFAYAGFAVADDVREQMQSGRALRRGEEWSEVVSGVRGKVETLAEEAAAVARQKKVSAAPKMKKAIPVPVRSVESG